MRFDTIVLGAGIVGVSTAIHLAQRGRSVVLVDLRHPGEGTSKGNAGLIQQEGVLPHAFPQNVWQFLKYGLNTSRDMRYHPRAIPPLVPYLARYWWNSRPDNYRAIVDVYSRLIAHAVPEHAALVEAAKADDLIVRNGWIEAYRSEKTFAEARHEAAWLASEYGINHARYDSGDLRRIEPALKSDDFAGAVHWTDPWTVRSPLGLTKAYFTHFLQLGGQYLRGDARSLAYSPGGQWSVKTSDGLALARDAVVALGPWSAEMVGRLGYRIPFAVQRGYSIHYRPDDETPLKNWFADRDGAYLLAPMTSGIRLTTGAEFARREAPATPVQLDLAETLARKAFHMNERADPEPWLGARPCTPDMMPVIGPAPRNAGLWFAFGHAHHGLTLGPATGRLIAEMITGEETFVDTTPYAASRFRSA